MVPGLIVGFEPWDTIKADIEPLLAEMGRDVVQKFAASPKLNHAAYEAAGPDLLCIAIRDGVVLVGFWMAFIFDHPHHAGTRVCATDLVYLQPEHRGGWVMIKAFRLLRDTAKARGCASMYAGSPIGRDLGPIFRRFGLAPVETQFSVWF